MALFEGMVMTSKMPQLLSEHDPQSFVIRINLVSATKSPGKTVPRIRIEHVNNRNVWHFMDVDKALARLRSSFDAVILGSLQ
jgi:hypothetical protein